MRPVRDPYVPLNLDGVDEGDFSPEERMELQVMTSDTRALARFLGSLMLRLTGQQIVTSSVTCPANELSTSTKSADSEQPSLAPDTSATTSSPSSSTKSPSAKGGGANSRAKK